MFEILREKKGSSLILVAMAMGTLIGFLSLTMDVGLLYLARRQMVNAADAGALAGAWELPDLDEAQDTARSYALKNGAAEVEVLAEGNEIEVRAFKDVSPFFQVLTGEDKLRVWSSARAASGYVVGARSYGEGKPSVVPIGVAFSAYEGYLGSLSSSGTEPMVLKEDGGGGTMGNYGALAIGGTGADNYRENLARGTAFSLLEDGEVFPRWVSTEPGVMAGPTRQGIEGSGNYSGRLQRCQIHPGECPESGPMFDDFFRDKDGDGLPDLVWPDPRCSRFVIVPLVESLEVPGRSRDVKVIGLAGFVIKEVRGAGEIVGWPARSLRLPGTDWTRDESYDFGLRTVKLIE